MNTTIPDIKEHQAAIAFGKQSKVFDKLYRKNPAIQYKRARVRAHLLSELKPKAHILELNCGTGEDAIFLAKKGYSVHATDISVEMLSKASRKVEEAGLQGRVSLENCSFNHLQRLNNKEKFDHIFSNFGGLNCTADLHKVLSSFNDLLKVEGKITLVIISRFCLWEFLLLFIGKWKTAFRRFKKGGTMANVEGEQFQCCYYSPTYIKKHLAGFTIKKVEGLCITVPPSYIEGFAGKHPTWYRLLEKIERKIKAISPWNRWGDYFIITAQKNNQVL